jgi:hypothetical protein
VTVVTRNVSFTANRSYTEATIFLRELLAAETVKGATALSLRRLQPTFVHDGGTF